MVFLKVSQNSQEKTCSSVSFFNEVANFVPRTNHKCDHFFSIAVHVFRNLFWKICTLFGQILITCLECSRTSFLLCTYSDKMCWGRCCRHENCNFNKKLWQRCFFVNFAKLLKTPFLQNTSARLLLKLIIFQQFSCE